MPKKKQKTPTRGKKRKFCCAQMEAQMNIECVDHEPGHCPDAVVTVHHSPCTFGIRVNDGGSSYLVINYCPWCGKRLEK